jgi:4-carboxymuconolactone decarboxylase
MRISENALKNHAELFPNRKSKLLVTDPELVEVFDNFAFDEVLAYGNLDIRTRLILILGTKDFG